PVDPEAVAEDPGAGDCRRGAGCLRSRGGDADPGQLQPGAGRRFDGGAATVDAAAQGGADARLYLGNPARLAAAVAAPVDRRSFHALVRLAGAALRGALSPGGMWHLRLHGGPA